MQKKIFIGCLFLSWSVLGLAQPIDQTELRANLLNMTFSSDGLVGSEQETGAGLWYHPTDSQDSILLVNQAGWWVRAMDPAGNKYLGTSRQHYPAKAGLLGDQGDFNRIWKVTRAAVNAHILDWQDNQHIDNPQESVFGWPGRGNELFAAINGFSLPNWGLNDLAPFFDQNANGQYEPDQGDYPNIQMGCSSLIRFTPGDLMWFPFYYEFSDYHFLQFHQTIFAWDCSENELLGNTVLLQTYCKNRGVERLDSVAISFFLDGNDEYYAGTRTLLGQNWLYSYPADGVRPMLGVYFLLTPLNQFGEPISFQSHMVLMNDSMQVEAMSLPETIPEYQQIQQGYWKDGTPLREGGQGYFSNGSTTTFAFDGLPESGNWTEWLSQNPVQARTQVATFDAGLKISASQAVTMTHVFLVEPSYSFLDEGITIMEQRLDTLYAELSCFFPDFYSLESTCDLNVLTDDRTILSDDSLWAMYPNPARAIVVIERQSSSPPEQLEVVDLLGRTMYTAECKGKTITLDTTHWPAGLYWVRLGATGSWKQLVITRF